MGGRGGIRTLGGFNPTAAFQATALNHYATRPVGHPPACARGKSCTVEDARLPAKQDFRTGRQSYTCSLR